MQDFSCTDSTQYDGMYLSHYLKPDSDRRKGWVEEVFKDSWKLKGDIKFFVNLKVDFTMVKVILEV